MITPGPVEPLSDDVCAAPSELEILDYSTSKKYTVVEQKIAKIDQ